MLFATFGCNNDNSDDPDNDNGNGGGNQNGNDSESALKKEIDEKYKYYSELFRYVKFTYASEISQLEATLIKWRLKLILKTNSKRLNMNASLGHS